MITAPNNEYNQPQAPVTVGAMIDWLKRLGRPPLPECPVQAAADGKDPKQPCFLEGKYVKSVNWKSFQSTQPLSEILDKWFADPRTGVGTLGGWNGKHWLGWIDFDRKTFTSPEECDRQIDEWVQRYPLLVDAPMFTTPGGGYRFLVAFSKEPEKFSSNGGFSLKPDGSHHVGELLTKNGGHTLLPPTRGLNGNFYRWEWWQEYPPVVDAPESIGLFPLRNQQSDSIGNRRAKQHTSAGGVDEFDKITSALSVIDPSTLDWNGWITIGLALASVGDPRLKQAWIDWTISSSKCDDGGERAEKQWETFKPKEITVGTLYDHAKRYGWEFPSNTSKNSTKVADHPTKNRETLSSLELEQRITELINQNPSETKLATVIPEIANQANRQTRDVWALYRAKLAESDLSDNRELVKSALPSLVEVQRERLDPQAFLWGDNGILARNLSDVALAMPTAVEFLMTTLIAVVGALIGTSGTLVVSARAKHTQPAIFRTAIVAPSGFKKTPAQSVIVDPLIDLEASEYKRWKDDQLQYKKDKAAYDKAFLKGDDSSEPPEEPIARKRYLASDSTFEALIQVHFENPRGVLVYRDEWSGHIKARNKYRNGAGDDSENELSEFNGKALVKDRVKESLFLAKSAISRTGSTQPETLKRFMGEHEDVTGEFARWLFCAAPCPPAYLDITSDNADADIGIAETLKDLYERLIELEAQDYFLSVEAKTVYEAYQHKLVDMTLAETQPGLRTAYPKFESYFARLTLWLHIVNAVLAKETKPSEFVATDTVNQASALTSYFIGQLRLIYATGASEKALEGRLLKIKEYVQGKPQGVALRQIRSNNSSFRKVSAHDINVDCQTLVSLGYIRSEGKKYFPVEGYRDDDGDYGGPPPSNPTPEAKQSVSLAADVGDVEMMLDQHHLQTLTRNYVDEFDVADVKSTQHQTPLDDPWLTDDKDLDDDISNIKTAETLDSTGDIADVDLTSPQHQVTSAQYQTPLDDPWLTDDKDLDDDGDNPPPSSGIKPLPKKPSGDGDGSVESAAPTTANTPHQQLDFEWLDPALPNYQAQCHAIEAAPIIALDIETYQNSKPKKNAAPKALHPWESRLRLIQLCIGAETYLIEFGGSDRCFEESLRHHQATISLLRQVLQNPEQRIVGHNIHFDLRFLATKLGITNVKNVACTMLGAQVYYGDYGAPEGEIIKGKHEPILSGGYSLSNLAKRFLDITLDKKEQKSDFGADLTAKQLAYAARDTKIAFEVYQKLETLYADTTNPLYSKGLRDCWQLESDVIPCAIEIELAGMPLDTDEANRQLETIQEYRQQLLADWSKLCPSVKHTQREKLLEHLTHKYQLKLTSLNKGSLDAQSRENPLLQLRLKLQGLEALANNLRGFLDSAARDGRVHTTYKTLTGFGRFSSGGSTSDLPNLQSIKSKSNPILAELDLPAVREAIKPAPGRTMAVIDLAGAHGRIAADQSADETAIAGNNDSSLDNHSKVAVSIAKAQGLDWSADYIAKVRKDKSNPDCVKAGLFRDTAKNTYYGWLNGAGAKRIQDQIAANTGVRPSLDECQAAIEGCKALYPKVLEHRKQLMRHLKNTAINIDGRLIAVNSTTDGFRICLPLVESNYYENQLEPPYTQSLACIWSRIEATAVKLALIKIMSLREQHPEWQLEVINYVHDEIDIEVNSNFTSVAIPLVNDIIGDCFATQLKRVSDGRETDWQKLIVNSWADK